MKSLSAGNMLVALALGPVCGAGTIAPARANPSFYPGLFPALTTGYAARLQSQVNRGEHRWLLDPVRVGTAFAGFIRWPAAPGSSAILQRAHRRVLVRIGRKDARQIGLYVELRRLGGIWSVVACHTADMRLTAPAPGSPVRSPLAVRGLARVFEGRFAIALLDIGWRTLTLKRMVIRGMERTRFDARVSFHARGPYGIVEAYDRSPKDGRLLDVAMVKVALQGAPLA